MRESLIERIVRIYGLEHEMTIALCELCERYPQTEAYDRALEVLVQCHEEFPVGMNEEIE